MSSDDSLETRWPLWPEGEPGQVLLDVTLGLPVDEAFLLLYGGLNDTKKALNEAVGNRDYSDTAWLPSAEAVEAATAGPTPPPLDAAGLAALHPGWLRRASYSGSMMGSKFRNEELCRLQEAGPGSNYRVLTTVLTTAMHGEKFRPVVASSLRGLPGGRTHYQIRSTIRFVVKPNGFIKAMIDRGAREGQRKNFEVVRRVLAQHTTVSEAPTEAAPAAAAAEAVPTAAAAAVAAPAAAPAGLLQLLVGAEACSRLDPWAAWLHGRLAGAVPVAGELVDAQVLLAVLAAGALLGTLHLVVDMLRFIQHASAQPRDSISYLTHYLLRVVDVPDSVQEVLLSCLILYTVRLLFHRMAAVLPAPPAHAGVPAAAAPAALGSGGGGAAGAAVGAAVGTAAGAAAAAGVGKTRSEEAEGEGIKYEGYAEAIAAAQAQPISPTGSPGGDTMQAAMSALGGKQAAASLSRFTKSISGAFAPGPRSRKSSAAGAVPLAAAAAAAAAAAGSASASPVRAAPLAESVQASSGVASPKCRPSEDGSEGAASAATSPLCRTSETQHLARVPGAAAGAAASPAASEAARSDSGALPPDRSLSPDPQRTSGDGVPHSKSAGALAAEESAASAYFFGRKVKAQTASGEAAAGSEGVTPISDAEMLSPTAAQRSFRPAMPAHLPPALASKAVIEEVFENQRLQPFRGWGHTWPGHFLPTDAVHHWSRREQEGFPVLAGADFPAIAPPLPELGSAGGGAEAGHAAGLQGCGAIKPPPAALAPPLQGWQWCEDKWHLDLSGQIIDACDEEGWSYALDFPYVRHPFQPNSGRKKMADFVRRRRWIRTRVPLALAAQPRATAIAADSSSWADEAAVLVTDALAGVFGSAGSEAATDAAEEQAADANEAEQPAAAAAPLVAEADGEGQGAGASEQREVAEVLESIFDRVEQQAAVESSMQAALNRPLPSSPDKAQHQHQRQRQQKKRPPLAPTALPAQGRPEAQAAPPPQLQQQEQVGAQSVPAAAQAVEPKVPPMAGTAEAEEALPVAMASMAEGAALAVPPEDGEAPPEPTALPQEAAEEPRPSAEPAAALPQPASPAADAPAALGAAATLAAGAGEEEAAPRDDSLHLVAPRKSP